VSDPTAHGALSGEPDSELPPPALALAIGAHPDDVEFGCGGTLAKWAAAGCRSSCGRPTNLIMSRTSPPSKIANFKLCSLTGASSVRRCASTTIHRTSKPSQRASGTDTQKQARPPDSRRPKPSKSFATCRKLLWPAH
jgi:hypothetical protein